MRTFLLILLVIGATKAYQLEQYEANAIDVIKNIISAFDGFFYGINVDGDLGNLPACLGHVNTVIDKTVEFIKSIDFKNLKPTEVIKLLSKLCGVLKEVFVLLKPCVKVPADIKILTEKIKKIDIQKLINGLILKSIKLYGYISEAIVALGEGNYYGFGENLGIATHILLFEKTSFSDS